MHTLPSVIMSTETHRQHLNTHQNNNDYKFNEMLNIQALRIESSYWKRFLGGSEEHTISEEPSK